jgi:anaerobic ribonucleoside-triphosphate reductase activating protein
MTLRVAKVLHDSVTDGPGLRVAVFFQGCAHRCEGCHNPGLLDPSGGEDRTADELLAEIKRNPLAAGVTFTGGEPMDQAAALLPVALALREGGYDLWIYTGFVWEDLKGDAKKLASLASVVVDGPYVAARRSLTLPWRGSSNQRIIEVNKAL